MIPVSPRLLGIVLRIVGVAAFAGLVVFVSFQWGKASCEARHAKAVAKIEGEHAENVGDARSQAAGRAIKRQRGTLSDEEQSRDIAEAAAAEDGADDLCVSADIVDRLRDL